MKLGTRIFLGFILTNVIFLALAITVYVFLRPVQFGSANLNENVLPLLDQASRIEYNAAMEAAELRGFFISHDKKLIALSHKYGDAVAKALSDIEDNLNSANGHLIKTNEIQTPLAALQNNYASYQKLVANVESNEEAAIKARQDIIEVHESFTKTVIEFIDHEQKRLDEMLDSEKNYQFGYQGNQTSQQDIDRRVERVDKIRDIRDEVDTLIMLIVRWAVEGNDDLYGKAGEMLKSAQANSEVIKLGSASADSQGLSARLESQMVTMKNNIASLRAIVIKLSQESAQRAELTNKVIDDAALLKAAGSAMAVKVAAESGSATDRVIWGLIIGTLIAVAVSIVSATAVTKGITNHVSRLIGVLNEGAQEVDNASGQLTHASNTLAEGATENAASLEETSAALEELSSMTRRNSDNAMEANALMQQATEAVGKAHHSMESVIRAMDEISVSGNEIGKIIKTIDEIAFQTNLLALNAAVEAARAGEAGAGFAVVADEVRNLAIRSADAAKNTADLIASTISNINSGSEMVNVTAETFTTVQTHSAKVAELLAEVAEASKEQSQGIGQITTAMTQMDKVTQSNAASAEESASSAGQLSLQAHNLLDAVDEMTALVHGARLSTAKNAKSRPVRQIPPRAKENKPPSLRSQNMTATVNDDDDFSF